MLRFPVGLETAEHSHTVIRYCGDVCEGTTNSHIFFSPVLFFEQPVAI